MTTGLIWRLVLVGGVLVGMARLPAQAVAPSPPVLTAEQKKDVLLVAKDVEIWTLRLQQASTELEKARERLTKATAAVTPPGYRLTDTLELVAVPEPTP